MEDKVFIDSSFFIALVNQDDSLHLRSRKLLADLQVDDFLPVTSNFIVSEVVTVLSQRVSKQLAVAFVQFVYGSSHLTIVTVDRTVELRAFNYLKNISSKNISFCDCVSLAILDLYRIKHLASFDQHFRIRGSNYKLWQ